MELLITLLIFAVVLGVLLYWVVPALPAPTQSVARLIVIVCAAIWFLLHVRQIVHGVMGLFGGAG